MGARARCAAKPEMARFDSTRILEDAFCAFPFGRSRRGIKQTALTSWKRGAVVATALIDITRHCDYGCKSEARAHCKWTWTWSIGNQKI